MKIATILDQIELELILTGKSKIADRGLLLKHLRYDMDTLLAMEEWDWAAKYLDPIITTSSSVRDYDLPPDFGENFMRGASDGSHYVCKIDDGTAEQIIDYESPAQFYTRDLAIETATKPTRYTITNKPDGTRRLSLSPKPDSNSSSNYGVIGLYIPITSDLHFESELPPIPRNADVLKWMVLRRFDQKYESNYTQSLAKLYGNAAIQRQARLVPYMKQGY